MNTLQKLDALAEDLADWAQYWATHNEIDVPGRLEDAVGSLQMWWSDVTNPLQEKHAPEVWRLPTDHPHYPQDRCYRLHPVGCSCDESRDYDFMYS